MHTKLFKLWVIVAILCLTLVACGYKINSQEVLIERMATSMLEGIECVDL